MVLTKADHIHFKMHTPHTHTHTSQKKPKHSSHGFDGNRRRKVIDKQSGEKRYGWSSCLFSQAIDAASHVESPQNTNKPQNMSCITTVTQTFTDDVVSCLIIIIIINPLTARVVGAPQMILQPVSPFFPVLHCPLGLVELRACPFPDVVFPPLPLSALSSFPFYCGQTTVNRSEVNF